MFQHASEILTLIASAAVQWLFYRKHLPKDFTPKRILVVKLDHLGDVILATPVFSNLTPSVIRTPNSTHSREHGVALFWSGTLMSGLCSITILPLFPRTRTIDFPQTSVPTLPRVASSKIRSDSRTPRRLANNLVRTACDSHPIVSVVPPLQTKNKLGLCAVQWDA